MAAPAREVQITYGTWVSGPASGYHPFGAWEYDEDYTRASFRARVLVTGSDPTELSTRLQSLRDAFRVRNQRLVVEYTDTPTDAVVIDLDPRDAASRNALVVEPGSRPVGSREQSLLAQLVEITVTAGLVADETGKAGRRDATVRVTELPTEQRLLEVTGSWTAVGATEARAQYDAQIASYISSIQTGLGGDWDDLVDEAATDQEDHVLHFRRVSVERLVAESAGAPDHAAIRDQSLVVVRGRFNRGHALDGTVAPRQIVARYSAAVVKSETQDLAGLWTGTVRPWLVSHVRDVTGGGGLAIVSEDPGLDAARNRIDARVEMLVLAGGSFLFSTQTTVDDESTGVRYRPVLDGHRHSKDRLQGTALWTRTIRTSVVAVGRASRGRGRKVADQGIDLSRLITEPGQGPGTIFGGRAGVDLIEAMTAPSAGAVVEPGGGGGGRGGGTGRLDAPPGFGDDSGGKWEAHRLVTRERPRTVGIPGHQLELVARSESVHMIFFRQGARASGGGGASPSGTRARGRAVAG